MESVAIEDRSVGQHLEHGGSCAILKRAGKIDDVSDLDACVTSAFTFELHFVNGLPSASVLLSFSSFSSSFFCLALILGLALL